MRRRTFAVAVSVLWLLYRRFKRHLIGPLLDRVFALWSYRKGKHFSLGWHDDATAAAAADGEDGAAGAAGVAGVAGTPPWKTLQHVVRAMALLRRLVAQGATPRLPQDGVSWEEGSSEERTAARVRHDGVSVRRGSFASPATELDATVRAVLPAPSHRAHFELVLPPGDCARCCPVVLHLAASGEEGFAQRRERLALPLARQHGVGSLILENAMYGARAPRGPGGSAAPGSGFAMPPTAALPGRASGASTMPTVAELLAMGMCTVAESVALLGWLRERGHDRLCVSGLSMGGEMATLVAACAQDHPVACAAFLPSHSTAAVFCEGVMAGSCDYAALSRLSPAQGFGTAAPDDLGCVGANRQILQITDIRSLPPPRCPAACVLVAAEDDGYIPPYSPRLIRAHWAGSELRWVSGGHCSAFLQQQPAFLQALVDALAALGPGSSAGALPPPPPPPAAVPMPPGFRVRCISAAAASPPPPSTPPLPHFADSFFRPARCGSGTTAGADATELSGEAADALAAISLEALVSHDFEFVATEAQRAERLAASRASLLAAATAAMAHGGGEGGGEGGGGGGGSSGGAQALWVLEACCTDPARCAAAAVRGEDGPWDAVGSCGLVPAAAGVDTSGGGGGGGGGGGDADAGCVAELRGLYVRADQRGQGLGRCLLHLAERFAVQAGYGSIWLETSRRFAAARSLYARSGFVLLRSLQNKWDDDLMLKRLGAGGGDSTLAAEVLTEQQCEQLSATAAQDVQVLTEHFPSSPPKTILRVYNEQKCDLPAAIEALLTEGGGPGTETETE